MKSVKKKSSSKWIMQSSPLKIADVKRRGIGHTCPFVNKELVLDRY
jgi:hypothetical protein